MDEEGYVVKVLKNGFVVLIPKYGIEGVVYTTNESGVRYAPHDETLVFASEEKEHKVSIFMAVKVRVSVEEAGKQAQRSKLVLKLVEPKIAGLSV